MKKVMIMIAGILLGYQISVSQVALNFNSNSGFMQSSVISQQKFSSPFSSNMFDLSYPADSNTSMFAGIGITQYFTYPEINYTSGFAGIGNSSYLDEEETVSLNLYLSGAIRKSLSIENFSDSYTFTAGSQYINALDDNLVLYAGSDFRYKLYSNVADLNFLENVTGVSLATSFETKTSIRLNLGISSKLYNGIINESTNTMGKGRNKIGLNSYSGMLKYEITAAQNLFEFTGISLNYSGNYSLNYYETPTDYIGYDFGGDTEFFDDPYSFNFNQFSAKFTQILPWEVKLTALASVAYKSYNYQVADEDEIYRDREDTQTDYQISLSKKIMFEESFLSSFKIELEYNFYHNTSNLDLMNIKTGYINIGFEAGL